jgi:amino acid adenylation domain-containing protein
MKGDGMTEPRVADQVNVCTLFDRSVRLYSDRTAISVKGRPYSYSDLHRVVDTISSALIARGCAPGVRVCLMLRHSLEMVAAIYAVMKLGATYVPVDPRAPIDRIRYVARDSGSSILLYSTPYAGIAAQTGIEAVCVDDLDWQATVNATARIGPDDLAYILYTSGSTGVPKGVGITHLNLLNYVQWAREAYFKTANDRIALYTTLAFDFTVTSIFPPLIAGASIGIYDGIVDPLVIRDLIADPDINIIKITPSYLSVLSQLLNGQRHIRLLIVGGEDLSMNLAARVHTQLAGCADIINEYGPTEATVGCLFHRFDPRYDSGESVPIGVPIANMHAYILDENGNVSPGEADGELCVSGRSVAHGYIGAASSLRGNFGRDPRDPTTSTYCTGDIVRKLGSGSFVFLGRRDDQVKIRGNRVELSEVTAALLDIPDVSASYVTSVRDQDSYALAAVVTCRAPLTREDISVRLERTLPSYMIPSTIKVIAEMPMTANQKIDREAVLSIVGKRGGKNG